MVMMIIEADEDNLDLVEEYLVIKGFTQSDLDLNLEQGEPADRMNIVHSVHNSFDRDYFKRLCLNGRNEFTKISCPYCNSGRLKVYEPTVHMVRDDEVIENPAELSFVFSLLLRCVDEKCHKCVSVGGKSYSERLQVQWDGTTETFEYFFPEWFYPPINIFNLPVNCPKDVAGCIKKSFSTFFNDPVAAGIHLRISLERLMDYFNVSIEKETKKGKVVRLNLHERIEAFGLIQEELANNLLALKWLGNDAGHEGTLSKEDVLDGYEIIEFVLDELFLRRMKKESISIRSACLIDKFDPKKRKE